MKNKKDTQFAGKTILVVHAMSPAKKFIFKRIKKMGLRVACLSKESASWAEPYVDDWILADLQNEKECLSSIKAYNAARPDAPLNGVVTFWDEAVLLTSRIVDAFNFIGIPSAIAEQVKNKFFFRNFCAAHEILTPRYQLLHSKKAIPALEKQLRYPLVVKPVYGACSAFVVRVNNRAEFEETYDYVKNNIKSFWLAKEWENFDLLVEEYIDGEEVDIDIILQHGKIKFYSISDNFSKSKNRFFVDSGQAIPSSLPLRSQQQLIDLAEETLEKLGFQNACIHFEAKLAKRGPYPIEINMRLGGDYVYSYVKSAWNVDLVEQAVKIALGIFVKIEKPETPYKYIIGWDLQPELSGILTELDISPQLAEQGFFEEINLFRETGDVVLRPPEGYDSLGWLTVSGDNLIDARDNLQSALGLIHYRVAEFNEDSTVGKTSRESRLSAAVLKKDFILQAAKLEKVRRISLSDQRQLHIGVAGNKSHFNRRAEHSPVIVTVKYIEEELRRRGYRTSSFDFNNLAEAFNEFNHSGVNLIFNVTEGINNNELLKPQAAALLEALQIPCTGSGSLTLALSQDKIRTKKLLNFHNIPTAPWDYAYTVSDSINNSLRYPLLVKPSNADDSFGITNSSVVTNKRELSQQLNKIIKELGRPALVEEYIEGDEYEVSILGNSEADLRVLPLSRSVFKRLPKGYWHIYTREAKRYQPGVYKRIIQQSPLRNVPPKLESLITEIALDAYKIMQCRDYGRVGVRVDSGGNPYVLEIDSNPPLNATTDLARTAQLVGMNFGDLLEEIISLAIKRYQNKKTILP